jgi:hypothetical protein
MLQAFSRLLGALNLPPPPQDASNNRTTAYADQLAHDCLSFVFRFFDSIRENGARENWKAGLPAPAGNQNPARPRAGPDRSGMAMPLRRTVWRLFTVCFHAIHRRTDGQAPG